MAGKQWDRNRIGPRFPAASSEDVADPANGGCYGCGDKGQLMDFLLVTREGKQAGRWRLCDACYEWGNPRDPQATDPLDATAA